MLVDKAGHGWLCKSRFDLVWQERHGASGYVAKRRGVDGQARRVLAPLGGARWGDYRQEWRVLYGRGDERHGRHGVAWRGLVGFALAVES